MYRKPKYYFYICLLSRPCEHKRQDRKTKLSICKNGLKQEFSCNQQYRIYKNQLDKQKFDLDKLRQKRFRE